MRYVTIFISSLSIAWVIFCLAGCVIDRGEPLGADEVAIYLAVVRDGGSNEFVISNEMVDAFGISNPEHMRSILPSAPQSATADFLSKAKDQLSWENDLTINDRFTLIGSEDRDKRLSQMYRYNVVSTIGFDPERKYAVVYYFDACQPLCGEGGFFLLESRDGRWVIVEESEKLKT
jgi:hypothetical protein